MTRLFMPVVMLGFLLAAGCGQVTTDADAPVGGPDAPGSTDGAPSDGVPPIDAPPDAPTDAIPASCGDGVVNGTDTCDDGANNGGYGFCNSSCSGPGARCGDGTQNGPEACDSGANNGMYGFCNSACTALGPRCGDGTQNGPETCDSGANNGSYGFCNSACTALGPRCGDGVQNGPETCDSGANNGQYGFCNSACTALGPRCGDSITNGPETCDQATVFSQTMAAGVCRPDCAGTVQQKSIQFYTTRVTPAQGGIAGIDNLCIASFGSTYRALVVDGSTRIATVTGNAGDGQVGWVVAAYTRYTSAETSALVFITDNTRLIGASGGQDRDLLAPIHSDDGWGSWTGANADWTSSTSDCVNWSSSLSTDFGLSCIAASTTTGTFPNNGGVSNCAQLRHFFCVQQ